MDCRYNQAKTNMDTHKILPLCICVLILNQVSLIKAQWTQWYNIDGPGGDGDFETVQRITETGAIICTAGYSLSSVQCREVNSSSIIVTRNATSARDNLTVACTLDGIQCDIVRQSDSTCMDYEVRFLCQAPLGLIAADYTIIYIAISLTTAGIIATLILIVYVAYRIHTITSSGDETDMDLHLIQKVKEKRMSADLHARRMSKIRVYTYENHYDVPHDLKLKIQAPTKPKRVFDDDGGVYDGTNTPERARRKDEVYYNSCIYDRGIETNALGKYIKQKTQANSFDIEFKELQKGIVHQKEIASKPENKSKNRYLTILPYDHSLVPLAPVAGMEQSNYINASYIDSTEAVKKYIATQGPMTKTVADFWLMIWQQESGIIIMLTQFRENNKNKCARYCPDKDNSLKCGVFNVTTVKHFKCLTYEHRMIDVQNSITNEKRTINHFQFTAWNDFGTPDHLSLVKFHRQIKKVNTNQSGPMVVHCSAGVGRTGTFIALDALLEQAQQTCQVQILNFVKLMRRERLNMIQTIEQYIFTYQVIYEALHFQSTEHKAKDFLKELHDCYHSGDLSKHQQIVREFTVLDEMRSVSTVTQKKDVTYKTPKGLPLAPTEENILVPAYGQNGGYIITRFTHKTTLEDLLGMSVKKNAHTILALTKAGSEFLEHSLPKVDQHINTEEYKVTSLSQLINSVANVITTTLEIKAEDTETCSTLTTIRLLTSCEGMLATEMSALIGVLCATRSTDRKTPILLLSGSTPQDGAKFAAVSNVIEDIIADKTVDVFNSVRQIHIRNQKLITNLEQYVFCYKAVLEFLLADTDYVNT